MVGNSFHFNKGAKVVPNNLIKLMDENGVNQKQLADIAGVSQAFICNMLKGYKKASVDVYKRIADYFKVTVDEII